MVIGHLGLAHQSDCSIQLYTLCDLQVPVEVMDPSDFSRRESLHSIPSVQSMDTAESQQRAPSGSMDLHHLPRRLAESPTFKAASRYFAEPLNDQVVRPSYFVCNPQPYYYPKEIIMQCQRDMLLDKNIWSDLVTQTPWQQQIVIASFRGISSFHPLLLLAELSTPLL